MLHSEGCLGKILPRQLELISSHVYVWSYCSAQPAPSPLAVGEHLWVNDF